MRTVLLTFKKIFKNKIKVCVNKQRYIYGSHNKKYFKRKKLNIIIKFITTLFNLYIVFYHNKKIIRSMNLEKNATVLDIGSHESELYKSLKQ